MVYPKQETKQELIVNYEDYQKEIIHKRINSLLNGLDIKYQQLMQDWYRHNKRQGLRLESLRAYLQHLKSLLRDIKKTPKQLTRNDIDNYLDHLENYKPKTRQERVNFLIKYLCWFFDKPKSEVDLIKDVNSFIDKGTKLPEELLTPGEIKKMVQVADNFRDKALVILLYETGARKGEFLQLKIKHIEIKEKDKKKYGFVTLPKGKTDSRKIPLIYSLPHIINWLNAHPNRDDPDKPLFITQGSHLGRGLGEDGLKVRLNILGKRANIKKRIYPHLFRHSRLTELAKELQEQELKIFAGWTPNSDMASVYIHLSGDDVSNKILANAGLIDAAVVERGKKILISIECPTCHNLNSSDVKYCSCGRVLDLKEAQKITEDTIEKENEIEVLRKDQAEMKAMLVEIWKQGKFKEIKT